LLAAAWVELNTGSTPTLAPGCVAGCYRVTAAGRQALKRVRVLHSDEALAAAGTVR
jgi:hypothetical protein